MKIKENTVTTLHFRLFDKEGKELDNSYDEEPIQLLIGQNTICEGLDEALLNKTKGDQFKVELDAINAFGEYDDDAIQTLPITVFEGIEDLEEGLELIADTDQGPKPITVTSIEDGSVTVNANHNLAGIDVVFDIKIIDVRSAAQNEIEHGHVH